MEQDERERTSWRVMRTADLVAVERARGRHVWRVLVSDSGREPFLSRWFNDSTSARDFIARLQSDARSPVSQPADHDMGPN